MKNYGVKSEYLLAILQPNWITNKFCEHKQRVFNKSPKIIAKCSKASDSTLCSFRQWWTMSACEYKCSVKMNIKNWTFTNKKRIKKFPMKINKRQLLLWSTIKNQLNGIRDSN